MAVHILAFADVHSTQYIKILISSLNRLTAKDAIDVVVMAGDIVDRGRAESLAMILNVLQRNFPNLYRRPIVVAVFGNEEYIGSEEKYYRLYPNILWLNDDAKIVNVNGVNICFVGSRGVLKKPTVWQQKNIENIEQVYRERLKRIADLINQCKKNFYTILVTHYASSYLTVYGEKPAIYQYLGYPIVEELAIKPDIAIHGHAHNAVRLEATIDHTRIYNVSLPARKDVTVITI